jgi:uncharacterized protein (TIGR03435 family)
LVLAAGLAGQTFEAASLKVAVDQRPRGSMRGGPGTGDPKQITFTNVLLSDVLLKAYGIKSYQLAAPSWMSSRRYEIVAKVPEGTTVEQFRQMLQGLLA